MTTPDEHRRNAIEKAARATEQHYILAGRTDADGYSPCVCGQWWDSIEGPGWDEHMAEAAYDAIAADLRRAFAEEAAAAIYTLPYLAELPTPDLESEVKVVSRPDVVRLVREIGGVA